MRSQTIHHEAIDQKHCPIKALIRRIKHTHDNLCKNTVDAGSFQLGTYFQTTASNPLALRATDINTTIKLAVEVLHLDKFGLTKDQVGSHSLRSGGAMAMCLNNIPEISIQKAGRWSSNTWLDYIQVQMACFSKGVSKAVVHLNRLGGLYVYSPTLNK